MQNDVKSRDLDRRIAAALQLNGRAGWNVIARHVGASESTVLRRAAQLTASGQLRVIGVLDVLRCGLGVPVLVRARCAPGTAGEVAAAFAGRPDARYVSVLAGSADCVAELVLPSYEDIAGIQLHGLPAEGSLLETETLAVMRTFLSNHDWNSGELDNTAVTELRGGDTRPFEEQHWESPPEKLDELDLAISAALGEDGRMPVKELAKQVDTSESTVSRRMDSLVRRGCLRFRTLAEPSLLGFALEFMLWLSILPSELDKAGQQLAAHPATKYLSATTGRFNVAGQIVLRHYGELYRYTTDVVGALPGLQAADVTLQVNTLKRAWAPTPAPRPSLENA
ncbi:DNA-binding Lrp family transcriptional regulator [Amycolatopsis bartoniae]|uniref:AsnC family transcriptional regulator n=1 Tax=Amycolatopsis bartoniae TaxID=941986 RepID=A0A8H9IYM5_9PSEU|nr:Lrp/AsnC family transcriptional regulator [Amycolatopsis bartoniae]MBB2938918.1 DNA-binding Lrp family transcriptional regulator [Amycolatopsis bartoniae]TVT11268.1 Lrp/AsnC family transcriptional regulator [Amycolatopsis bartoniae]GHF66170.1 AsnC family transcriptional regulator [Amycolatopsis bartoniae]